jgi:hypothetical protein
MTDDLSEANRKPNVRFGLPTINQERKMKIRSAK